MNAIMRTQDVTVADAWANDDGGVSLEVEGKIVPVSPEEAIAFAVLLYAAAVDAAEAIDEKADAEQTIAELEDRVVITHWNPYAEVKATINWEDEPRPHSWGGRL